MGTWVFPSPGGASWSWVQVSRSSQHSGPWGPLSSWHVFPRETSRPAPGGQGEAHGQHRLVPEVGQHLAGREEGHRREAAEKHLGQDRERQGLLWGPGDQTEGSCHQKERVGATPVGGQGGWAGTLVMTKPESSWVQGAWVCHCHLCCCPCSCPTLCPLMAMRGGL